MSDVEFNIKTKADTSGVKQVGTSIDELGDKIESKLVKKLDKVFGVGGIALGIKGLIAGGALSLIAKVFGDVHEIDALASGIAKIETNYVSLAEKVRETTNVVSEDIKRMSGFFAESLKSQIDEIEDQLKNTIERIHVQTNAVEAGFKSAVPGRDLAANRQAIEARKAALQNAIGVETQFQKELAGQQPDQALIEGTASFLENQGQITAARIRERDRLKTMQFAAEGISQMPTLSLAGKGLGLGEVPEEFKRIQELVGFVPTIGNASEFRRRAAALAPGFASQAKAAQEQIDQSKDDEKFYRDRLLQLAPGIKGGTMKDAHDFVNKLQEDLNKGMQESGKRIASYTEEIKKLDRSLETAIAVSKANEEGGRLKTLKEVIEKDQQELATTAQKISESLEKGHGGVVESFDSLGNAILTTTQELIKRYNDLKAEIDQLSAQFSNRGPT